MEPTTYAIPAELMHMLIYSILGALAAVGAYMVVWAINDTRFKTGVLARLTALESLIKLHDSYRAEHDEYTIKVDYLEQRVGRLEK